MANGLWLMGRSEKLIAAGSHFIARSLWLVLPITFVI
jgi:hypothetical protein